MTDTSTPTTLGQLRSGSDPRVPGLTAEVEQLRDVAGAAQGVAARALGMVEGVTARLEAFEAALERLGAAREQPADVPPAAEVAEHVGELEGRLNLLAKVIVATNPDAAAELRRLSEAAASGD